MTFDLMRGYFLIAITLNHLYYFPGFLDWVTMRGDLFVSSAEGFFLISGLILGLVRGAKLVEKPFRLVAKLLLKRSVQLYVTYVILTLLFTFIGWQFMGAPGLKSGIASVDTPILDVIWNTVTFQYLYGWADYLRLYAIFIFCSPLAMWLLRRGKWWIVLSISVVIWLIAPEPSWPANVYSQPQNWQIIFFSGMVIGFHWQEIINFWRSRSRSLQRTITAALLTVATTTLALNIFLAFGGMISAEVYTVVAPIREALSHPYFDKENLPYARLALFMIWFWAAFVLFRRFESHIIKWLGWLLIPFGTNSLYVYIVSGLIIFFVHLFIPAGGKLFNTLILIGILLATWLLIRHKVLMKIIPR